MSKVLVFGQSHFPISRKIIRRAVEEILKEQGVKSEIEVEISMVGDRKMRQLHKQFMGQEETTDVLSFPLEDLNKGNSKPFVRIPDEIVRLGNIVISYPMARKQAQEFNVLVDEEIKKLVKHGMSHLLGIHHE